MSRSISAPGLRLCGAFDQGLIAAHVQGSAAQAATSAAPGYPSQFTTTDQPTRRFSLTAGPAANNLDSNTDSDAELIAAGTDVLVNLSLYFGPQAEPPFARPGSAHRTGGSSSMEHLEAVLDGMQRSIDTLRGDVNSLRFPVELVGAGPGQFDGPYDGPRRPAA